MQKILGVSTRGYLGLLDDILRNVVRRALRSERSQIDLNLLSQTAAEYHGWNLEAGCFGSKREQSSRRSVHLLFIGIDKVSVKSNLIA